MERVLKRVATIVQGNPLDTDTRMGAQASQEQLTKIMSYLDIGKQEGAELLIGGKRTWVAIWKAATTSSPRCSRATTRCAFSRKKSSARCWP